jgi:hypothetical protein
VTKTAAIRPIAERFQRPNSAKMVILNRKLFREKVSGFSFQKYRLFEKEVEHY